jgi:predicted site-specific integrase-resolvase
VQPNDNNLSIGDLAISQVHGANSTRMKRAALYARVSTDKQREEATIESQLFELKKQYGGPGT